MSSGAVVPPIPVVAARGRILSRRRVVTACVVAIAVDGLQLALGPLGWVGVDQAIDVVAMGILMWLLGFHVLLLPTVVLEALPLVDAFPTWTVCVFVVVLSRRRDVRGS